jgi:hypothetical protein
VATEANRGELPPTGSETPKRFFPLYIMTAFFKWVKQQGLEQQFFMLTEDQNLHGAKKLHEYVDM